MFYVQNGLTAGKHYKHKIFHAYSTLYKSVVDIQMQCTHTDSIL